MVSHSSAAHRCDALLSKNHLKQHLERLSWFCLGVVFEKRHNPLFALALFGPKGSRLQVLVGFQKVDFSEPILVNTFDKHVDTI